ncbi:LysM peptidoglycan-binding domain-containing protein [Halobacillus fulvus]|nr:LysM peptidoglycan-binding domain-containing protein [Halobacillus fulvus]
MKKSILSLAAVGTIMAATTVTASAEDIVVEKGDTLWSIAQDNGVSVNDIKQANGLDSNLIFPQQTLSLGGQTASAESSNTSGTHTVKSGDTLWSIAQDNGTSVAAIKSANGLNSNLIYPGQELALNGSAAAQPAEATQTSAPSTTESTEQKQTSSSEQEAAKTLTMEATAYTAFCEGCSGTTYTGIDLRANPDQKVIAVDPDVIPLGTEVYVEGYGKAVAGDIGGAIQGNRIDVFMPERSDALDFGRQTVEVQILE